MVIDLAIKTKGKKMIQLKLFIYGLAIASIILFFVGCAGQQPMFCPEVSFKLCPTR